MKDNHYLGKGLGFLIPGGVLGIISFYFLSPFVLQYKNYASTLFVVFALILCVSICFILIGIYNLTKLRQYRN